MREITSFPLFPAVLRRKWVSSFLIYVLPCHFCGWIYVSMAISSTYWVLTLCSEQNVTLGILNATLNHLSLPQSFASLPLSSPSHYFKHAYPKHAHAWVHTHTHLHHNILLPIINIYKFNQGKLTHCHKTLTNILRHFCEHIYLYSVLFALPCHHSPTTTSKCRKQGWSRYSGDMFPVVNSDERVSWLIMSEWVIFYSVSCPVPGRHSNIPVDLV